LEKLAMKTPQALPSRHPNYFFQRKGELGRRGEPPDEKAPSFIQLKPPLPVAGAVELHFGEVSLSLPASASPSWVATLMRELAGATV